MLQRPRLPTRREPRQGRAVATRRTILTAALKALREHGADVSMSRIAELSGYGIGTVYEYFPNRRTLLCELMHQICEDELEAILALAPTLRDAPLATFVTRTVGLLVAWAEEHAVLTRLLAIEVIPTLQRDEIEDFEPLVAAALAAELGRRADEVAAPDLARAAQMIVRAVESIIEDAVLQRPHELAQPAFADEIVALVLGYLGRARGSVS
ncbi:MAG: TetR/AcrR family transcriptional regulator [Nannocystaceae bacterium]|nr:TetR/AcrR family transcriptional regulator [Nannocystaceae bacterium]